MLMCVNKWLKLAKTMVTEPKISWDVFFFQFQIIMVYRCTYTSPDIVGSMVMTKRLWQLSLHRSSLYDINVFKCKNITCTASIQLLFPVKRESNYAD